MTPGEDTAWYIVFYLNSYFFNLIQGSASVSAMAAMFNQQPAIIGSKGPPPIARKPPKELAVHNGNSTTDHSTNNNPTKRLTPTHPIGGLQGGIINEIGKVKLKKAPPPKPPVKPEQNETPFNRRPSLNKAPTPVPAALRPKPKPAAGPKPRHKPLSSVSSSDDTKESLNSKSSLEGDSTSLSSFTSTSESSFPRTSSESTSYSRDSSASRRTSGKPELNPLPPVEVLGAPPPKPRKRPNIIKLPSPTHCK